jgi:hypothetical protein
MMRGNFEETSPEQAKNLRFPDLTPGSQAGSASVVLAPSVSPASIIPTFLRVVSQCFGGSTVHLSASAWLLFGGSGFLSSLCYFGSQWGRRIAPYTLMTLHLLFNLSALFLIR